MELFVLVAVVMHHTVDGQLVAVHENCTVDGNSHNVFEVVLC